jgi:hypothetical protein
MVIECVNCEFACHKGNPNLPFDAKECDIKIGLRMENKMGHAFHPDVMYYGSHLVMVTPIKHDGSGDEWVVNHWFWHSNSDKTYFDECIQQNIHPLIEYNLNVNWNDSSFTLLLKTELKTSQKLVSLCFQKRKAIMQGWMTKQQERRAMHEQHVIDLTIDGANFTSSISRQQQLLIAGTTICIHGMRKFTPQMIAGATCDQGMYCFFQAKELALSLMMLPNGNAPYKKKKEVVKVFKVFTHGRLVTFTCEVFGIQLWRSSPYTLCHCLVDVGSDKQACYATREAAIFAACIRGVWNTHSNVGRLGMVYPLGSIKFFLFSEKVIPYTTTVACSITSTRRFIWRGWSLTHHS